MRGGSHPRSILRCAASALLAGLMMIFALLLLAWLAGRIVSDRFWWSQWLLWVPTPPVIGIAILGTLAAMAHARLASSLAGARRGRRGIFLWAAGAAAIVVYFSVVEHRLLVVHRGEAEGVRIVHWNATPIAGEDADDYRRAIFDGNGDITILTDAYAMPWHPSVRDWLGEDGVMSRTFPFTILTRVPLQAQRVLVAKDEMYVLLLQFDTTAQLGRPLIVYAVDMPSDLSIPRAALARDVRRMLDEAAAPPPDLVIGDFNISRGGASLGIMFPGLRHAFHEAGRGYGATFHCDWPLYHIDHALLGANVAAGRYEIAHPGVGRHLVQAVTIAAR